MIKFQRFLPDAIVFKEDRRNGTKMLPVFLCQEKLKKLNELSGVTGKSASWKIASNYDVMGKPGKERLEKERLWVEALTKFYDESREQFRRRVGSILSDYSPCTDNK